MFGEDAFAFMRIALFIVVAQSVVMGEAISFKKNERLSVGSCQEEGFLC